MRARSTTRIGIVLGLAAVCAVIAFSFAYTPPAGAADPSLQAAPTLLIDDCIEVSAGEQFDVDIKARGVSNLIAWEVYFAYNRRKVEVVNKDVDMLLASGREAVVFDVSDPVPNSTGFYRLGAADVGRGDGLKQGDVLVRLTLRAKEEGVTPALIFRGDYSGDGVADFGPTLTSAGQPPVYLGDTNGDQVFDGKISSGQIAIGTSCVQPEPPPLQPGESEAVRPDPEDPSSESTEGNESAVGGSTGPGSEGGDGETGGGTNSGGETSGNQSDEPGGREDGESNPEEVLNANTSSESTDGRSDSNQNDVRRGDSGIGGGFVPWLLIGLGVAVAASGGITFYMIRAASKEPY
jgi:hypothetical protein